MCILILIVNLMMYIIIYSVCYLLFFVFYRGTPRQKMKHCPVTIKGLLDLHNAVVKFKIQNEKSNSLFVCSKNFFAQIPMQEGGYFKLLYTCGHAACRIE